MKLAMFDDKNVESDIIQCCINNDASYIPIADKRFGILTSSSDLGYGSEDSDSVTDITVKPFVNIYECTVKVAEKNKSFFKKKPQILYTGKILDNYFFQNVSNYCGLHNILIESIRIITESNAEYTISDSDKIISTLNSEDNLIIKKMTLDLDKHNLILSKRGYVDLFSKMDYFNKNKTQITELLRTGFGN
jgi:hypothetical protein